MKKTLLLVLGVVCIGFNSHATVYTVNNSAPTAQFTTIQAAIDSASTGDTILINASQYPYYELPRVTKRLVIIGNGNNKLQQTQQNYHTYLYTLPAGSQANFEFTPAAAGSVIKNLSANIHVDANNITVDNVFIQQLLTLTAGKSNLLLKNSIVSYVMITNGNTDCHVSNCIIGSISVGNNAQRIRTENNMINGAVSVGPGVRHVYFSNNIFRHTAGIVAPANGAVFTNSLVIENSNGTPLTFPGDAFVTNTFAAPAGVNQFIDEVAPDVYLFHDNSVFATLNLALNAGSVGKNNGTDGKDIGLYGGKYPMPGKIGQSEIPTVTNFKLHNTVIAPATPVNATVKARKGNK